MSLKYLTNINVPAVETNRIITDGITAATRTVGQVAKLTNATTGAFEWSDEVSVDNVLVIKGSINASTATQLPAANQGDVYVFSVGGTFLGQVVKAGETVICIVDGTTAGTATTNWIFTQNNVDLATDTTAGLVELATVAETEAKSSTSLAVTPAGLATYVRKFSQTVGDGSATSYVVTHNLGTKVIDVTFIEVATDEIVIADAVATSTNTTTVSFATAPTANQFLVIIKG